MKLKFSVTTLVAFSISQLPLLTGVSAVANASASASPIPIAYPKSTMDTFFELEKKLNGRIGVYALETESAKVVSFRADEKFMMCSTFKALLAAHILQRVDQKMESLSRRVSILQSDLLAYAPITSRHVSAQGMSIRELAQAAIQYSDNTAANLLLRTQDGPAGLTRFLHSIGDEISHLDRIEPELNTPVAGRELDMTTPKAMAETLKKLLFEKILTPESQKQLKEWLLGNTTGEHRLKAGLPKGWTIGDKTGSGDHGATNDIGVLYPPSGSPISISVFAADSIKKREDIEAIFPEIAKLVLSEMSRHESNK